MSAEYARAIVNPAAGGHSIHREWPWLSRRLADNGLAFECVYTEGTGHAAELARGAVDDGCRYIIAVGGDGTVNEVANGILTSSGAAGTTLGIVSAGTTCSFARSLGIPADALSSCRLLASRNRLAVDIGMAEYSSKGKPSRRYFVNEADIGFGAAVVEAARKVPTRLGRRANYLPYLLGGVSSLVSHRNKQICLRADDGAEDICVCAMVAIVNGKHFGGGMCLAPDARPDDGWLDMVIFGDMGKPDLVKVWPLTYNGLHVSHDKVRLQKVKRVAFRCAEAILVEADGELLGESPASFSVLPSALRVVVP